MSSLSDVAEMASNPEGWAEKKWAKNMPPGAKDFFLANNEVVLSDILKWWGARVAEWKRTDLITHRTCEERWVNPHYSWELALHYACDEDHDTAIGLIMNGTFLEYAQDVRVSSIRIRQSVEANRSAIRSAIRNIALQMFDEAPVEVFREEHLIAEAAIAHHPPFKSVYQLQSGGGILRYLGKLLGNDQGDYLTHKLKVKDKNKEFVEWCQSTKIEEGEKITVAFLDEGKNEVCKLTIGCSTKLKTLFNNYAEEKGVSLRSLRFSYKHSTLFLSSVGNKTPEELGMNHLSVITVTDTSQVCAEDVAAGASSAANLQKGSPSPKKGKGKRKKGKKKGGH